MTEFLAIAGDSLLDAVKDTFYVMLFLFVTYVAMEWLEHKTSDKARAAVKKAGAAGPAVGALLGAIPQCGFSAAASTFYAGRVITLGTLFAVFLSTSDEMLPIFIAEQVPATTIIAILLTKILIGLGVGFCIDAVCRIRERRDDLRIHDLCEQANCFCEERCSGQGVPGSQGKGVSAAEAEHAPVPHEHHHHSEEECTHHHGTGSILLSAVKHTLQITLFVFLISLALNILLGMIGEETLSAFMSQNIVLSVVAASVVGLIPNCAASVAIAQLYVDGVLCAGAMIGGLLVSAGVGILVLVRTNREPKENIAIILGLLAVGIISGLVVAALGIVF